MPIADGPAGIAAPETLLSDDAKNQNAANRIRRCCARAAQHAELCVNRLNEFIAEAPGDKAAVLAKLSAGDKTEVEAIAAAQVALYNAHSASSDISF